MWAIMPAIASAARSPGQANFDPRRTPAPASGAPLSPAHGASLPLPPGPHIALSRAAPLPVPALTALLAQQLLIVGFGVTAFGLRVPHPFLLLGVLVSWSCALLGLGALLGVLVRSMGELSACYDIGGMLLSSVGGALVPLSVLPAWVADVAPLSPGYWAAHGLRAALAGDTATATTACGTLFGVAAVCAILASVRLQGRGGRVVAL